MTFDDLVAKYDLSVPEQRVCREYLIFLRTRALARAMLDWVMTSDTAEEEVTSRE